MPFDPISLVAGGLSAGGDIIGTMMQNQALQESQTRQQTFDAAQANQANAFTERMANSAMSFSAQQADVARGYDTQMSNTAHQREVADLRAAGLNPILSAGGGGASSPSSPSPSGVSGTGQAAHAQQAQVHNLLSGVTSSALQAANIMKQNELIEQQTATSAETANKMATDNVLDTEKINTEKLNQNKARADILNTIANTDATKNNAYSVKKYNELLDSADPNLAGLMKAATVVRQLISK